MNHIFKKIWNKSLGRMVVVSEHAKSAGKTDNTTGTQSNSLSNIHDDEQGKNFVFSFKPLVLKSLVLSIAAITGVNVWADDNYAHISTDTALGSAKGYAHATTKEAGTNKITKVGGITVTTTGTGTSLDDIDSFTANSIKITDPAEVAAFINAAKKGGNIAIGDYSSAMGTANIALGSGSSAMGFENSASGFSSSAVGFRNEASGQNSNAVGVNNIASGNSSSALGTYNIALGGASSAVGYGNAASGFFSNAIGVQNSASKTFSNAIGSHNQATGTLSNAIGSGINNALIVPGVGGVITSIDGIPITTTATSVAALNTGNITAIDGNTNPTSDEKQAFIDAVQKGQNIASGVAASAVGVSNNASGAGSNAVGLANTASGSSSTALGNSNSASGFNNSAVGFNNTASNGDLNNAFGAYNKNNGAAKNTAVGIGNIINSSAWGTNALGYSNNVSNLYGSAIGTKNTVTVVGGNAIGLNNIVTGGYANAIGTGNTVIGQNGAAVGSGLADYAGNLGPQVVLTPFSYTPTFSSVGGVTTLDGVVIKTSAADWAALSANPSLLTEVNGQSVTAAQAT
ncbi:hypothetical protein F970_02874, partial [Acinetobacter sp. CIP 102082]|uniref:ESPR-type extended signal peptide-containing protein n=1 Tax=Acinetobacter sp. CIP 102082 TaxID=1144663 RepID=UPI0002D0E5E5